MSGNYVGIEGWDPVEGVLKVAVLYWDSNALEYVKGTQPGGGAGETVSVSNFPATQAVSIASLPALAAGSAVIGHVIADTGSTTAVTGNVAITAAALPLPSTAATDALQSAGNASLTSVDGKTPALGQQLAAASSPVVLTALQVAALTPPAAITGFAVESAQTTGNASLATVAAGVKAEDSVAADGDYGSANLALRQDMPTGDTSATGDYSWIKTDAQGRLWVNSDALGGLLQQGIDTQRAILAELRLHTLLLQMAFNITDDANVLRNDSNITLQ